MIEFFKVYNVKDELGIIKHNIKFFSDIQKDLKNSLILFSNKDNNIKYKRFFSSIMAQIGNASSKINVLHNIQNILDGKLEENHKADRHYSGSEIILNKIEKIKFCIDLIQNYDSTYYISVRKFDSDKYIQHLIVYDNIYDTYADAKYLTDLHNLNEKKFLAFRENRFLKEKIKRIKEHKIE